MELYKRYRPKRLKQMLGNKTVIHSIQSKLNAENLPHAMLFTGPKGTGKTTFGRIIAHTLKIKDLDYTELDSGVFRGIDTVRDLRKQIQFKPLSSPAKLILIDECHMLGAGGSSMKNPAQNALLKMLEDGKDYVYFILCTTDPQMLIAPVKSRCIEYKLNPLNDEDMKNLLSKICRKEKKNVPDEVFEQIIKDCQGIPRDSLQVLDKIIDMEKDDMLQACESQKELESAGIELSRALLKGQSWNTVAKILKGLKNEDPEGIRRHILAYMQNVLLGGERADNADTLKNALTIMTWFEEPTYNIGFPGIVLNCRRIIKGVD